MKLPNFLIIGVQKAGTTSIYNYLKQHTQVYMSPIKETNFLSTDTANNSPSQETTTTKYGRKKILTLEDYAELFEGVTDEIAIGEISPNYLVNYPTVIKQIKHYIPDAKLICILRNPIDRAYSDYLMHIRDAITTKSKSRTLSEQIKYSPHKSSILRKGFYYEQLKHFFAEFDQKQIRVYLYDDLCKEPVKFMQEIYDFIGVDHNFIPDTSKKAQVAEIPKNKLFNEILRTENPLRVLSRNFLKIFLPLEARQIIRNKLIKSNLTDKTQIPPLTTEEKKQLLELYREDISKLQDLIKRDLSAWLKI
jgi:hypothetical protein